MAYNPDNAYDYSQDEIDEDKEDERCLREEEKYEESRRIKALLEAAYDKR
jgi:hypothetical protein